MLLPPAAVAGDWLPRDPPAGAEAAWRLSVRSQKHNDAMPLAAMGDDDWSALRPRPGLNLAYLDEEVRLQRRSGAWTFGLLGRQYATVVASQASLQLAAMLDAGQRPATDAAWQLDVKFRGFSGVGGLAAREWALAPAWTLAVSTQALVLERWRERSLAGPVGYTAADATYGFNLKYAELDNRLEFPYQQPFAAHGAGLLLGAELHWQQDDWSASAALFDGGWLHWRGMPQQQATADTAAQGTDPDGFPIYLPLVQGTNSQAGLTRRQPFRGRFAVARDLGGVGRIGLAVETLPGFGALPALNWRQNLGSVQIGLGWQLHERRATLALAWRGLQLQAGADRLGAQARSRDLGLAWQIPL
ncbi:MAG: hypothetical protein JNL87_06110 [Burkholderiaceae bacterium]|nr:hypothetical protein [Burkholderiaceae bacterium]